MGVVFQFISFLQKSLSTDKDDYEGEDEEDSDEEEDDDELTDVCTPGG